MDFNDIELKIAMLKRNITVEGLSDILNISRQATNKKMNGEIQFSVKDIRAMKKAKLLNDEEIKVIFFSNNVE